jgi:hypothetical protein
MNHMENYKCVITYDKTADISHELINSLLERSWKITPSKNNFMPYIVHVVGPQHQEIKSQIYELCRKHNIDSKKTNLVGTENLKMSTNENPRLLHVSRCSYLLIFTQRDNVEPNNYHQELINRGCVFEQMKSKAWKEIDPTTHLEVGFFANTLSSLCLEHKLDVSYTLCFLREQEVWNTKLLNFVKHPPSLLMTIGKGLLYNRDIYMQGSHELTNLKPDYDKIVNFIK